MKQERWQQVRNIFDGALERAPDKHSRFLDEICANDKDVRREVESLLSSLGSADSFMETPAVAKVADVIEAEQKNLETGRCFGHYEIIQQIGAGEMGEVYLANATKLNRRVALKFLPADAVNSNSRKRFQREAEAVVAPAEKHPDVFVPSYKLSFFFSYLKTQSTSRSLRHN